MPILKVKPKALPPKEPAPIAREIQADIKKRRRDKDVPQEPEMEKATLGAILQNPEPGFSLFDRLGRQGFFYNKTNKTIFELARSFWEDHARLDWVTFTSDLRSSGRITELGGDGYFLELFDVQYRAIEPLEYYIERLRDKYIERALYSQALDIISPKTGTEKVTLQQMVERVENLKKIAGSSSNGCEHFELQELLGFNPKDDPDCLVGFRWLNRGGAALWAGGSGYGKSSLEIQLAIYWACGASCFGLRPVRPLKSLIIQAENDKGDTAEQIQGVLKGIENKGDLDVDEQRELIQKHVVIYRVIGKTGAEFLSFLDGQIQLDRPHLVWIDPLFAFAGCDLLNPEKTGRFLREGLFPIAHDRKVCLNVLHHIGKPPKDQNSHNGMNELDYQYLGFGTSEIQNAFRAVNVLVPIKKSGTFKLVLSKRGDRAGAKDVAGEWARELYLEHARGGDICWIQCMPPSEVEGDSDKFTKEDILLEMSDVNPLKTDTVYKRCYREKNAKRATFFRHWAELKRDGTIIERPNEGWIISGLKKERETKDETEVETNLNFNNPSIKNDNDTEVET